MVHAILAALVGGGLGFGWHRFVGCRSGRILAFAGLLPIVMGVWGPCLVNLAIHRFKRA